MPFRLAKANSLLALIILGAIFAIHARGAVSNNSVTLTNSTPVVTNVIVNNGSPITLTANATTSVVITYTVTDANGCGDVRFSGTVSGALFRSGVGSSCSASTLNCYTSGVGETGCTSATSTQTSYNTTATLDIYYFAQATDASSSFPSENWLGYVQVTDGSGAAASATSTGVELNTLSAIEVSTSTNYGSVPSGGNTSSTNQVATVKNAGNSSTTLNLSGTALTSGSFSIPTSSQHYATSTFTFGGLEQALSATAQAVSGFLIPRPPIGTWTNTSPLTGAVRKHKVFTYGNFIYAIGGFGDGGVSTSTVLFAPINATGSIGSWTATTPLPSNLANHGAFAKNGFAYVVGGFSATSTVLFAPINATGSIGSWTATTPLPQGIDLAGVSPHREFVYVAAGRVNGGSSTSTVFFASLNATGSVGTWTATAPLPAALSSPDMIGRDNFLYVSGGTSSGGQTSTVLLASVNATGSLAAWAATTPMPNAVSGHSLAEDGGVLYVTGGFGGSQTSTVSFAPIGSDGTLGTWSLGTSLPNPVGDHGSTVRNGYLYSSGGIFSPNSTSTNWFVSLSSRNTYWGIEIPAGSQKALYTGTNNFTAVFSP